MMGCIALLLLALLSTSCGSIPFISASTPTSSLTATPPPTPLPESPVEFQVRVPAGTPSGEPVLLSILDEVTGLALNVKNTEMKASGEQSYTLKLNLPVGTVLKYRYARQGSYLAQEHTSAGSPVRYRLYRVEGPGTVQDVISAWNDVLFSGPSGRISGHALDAKTGAPVPSLLVVAGGAQTLTASDGSFRLEGLPPGTHTLVGYALDGAYRTFQQGAIVADGSTTPAELRLEPAPLTSLVFTLTVPPDTMRLVPIRLAGNLYQLGNTFADLAGGMSTLASRMPALSPLPDGRYSVAMNLPVGADVYYKYTLGDGLWNAEHGPDGEFTLRHLIVPENGTVIEDRVYSWGQGDKGPVVFDLTTPANTPETDSISIQFNPYGWTEPIPMWYLGKNHWAYALYSPLDAFTKIGYRYCRDDQCGSADDAATSGDESFGRILDVKNEAVTIQEKVDEWAWYGTQAEPPAVVSGKPKPRAGFVAGVEFQPAFHPSWEARLPVTFKELQTSGVNWIMLAPTWTYTRSNPPIIEPVTGADPLWADTAGAIEKAYAFNLNAGLDPTARFPSNSDNWWAGAQRDYAWWLTWFDRYRSFALHHADLAESLGVQVLVLGGEWVTPALPGGKLADGSPSGVPADAEARWRELIAEVRTHYKGVLLWSLPYSTGFQDVPVPPFLDAVDQVYLLWSTPLAKKANADEEKLQAEAARLLDADVKGLQSRLGKPVVLGISYPSAGGALTGCVPDPMAGQGKCLDPDLLARPNADIPAVTLDLEGQARAYDALLSATNENKYISGFISRGYYPPAALRDKSASVHGKPAGDVLSYWYPRLLGTTKP